MQNLLIFVASCFVLIISSIFLVKSLHRIAVFFGITDFSAAFIIIAFATSLPELFVGISSSLQGVPQLSMGNIIGANIIDLTLLIGIFIFVARGIKFKEKEINRDFYFMITGMLVLIILYLIGNSLSRIDGVILLCLFSVQVYSTINHRKKYPNKLIKNNNKKIFLHFLIFIVAVFFLFLSSKYVVQSSQLVAFDLNISEIIIGLFLISIATTLPELIFGINAILLKHPGMAIGDQTGTIFTNICLILGVVAVIHPIQVPLTTFIVSSVFMLVSGILFILFIKSGKRLAIWEGISLIGWYLLFIILQFLIPSLF